jgi:hypothetical protein
MAMNKFNQEATERHEIETLLPWHATGTLNRRDADRVERALARDNELVRRLELVREELQETIHLNESLGAPSARAAERLFAAIDAEGGRAGNRRPFDLAGRLADFLAGFAPRTLAYSAAAAGLAILVQAAVLGTIAVKDHAGSEIVLASYNNGEAPGVVVRFSPQATAAQINGFLASYKAEIVSGPKRGNFYQLRLSEHEPNTDITAVVRKMQGEAAIVEFVAAKE